MANKGNFLEKYSNYLTRGGKSKQLPLRGRRYSMPPEDRPDTLGIDLGSVAGQVKTSLWDLFRDSMYGYLTEGTYSDDRLQSFIKSRSLRVPIDLPGDYGVDIDINRPAPGGGGVDDYRFTIKKEF